MWPPVFASSVWRPPESTGIHAADSVPSLDDAATNSGDSTSPDPGSRCDPSKEARMLDALQWHEYTEAVVKTCSAAAVKGLYFARRKADGQVRYVGIADSGHSIQARLVAHLNGATPAEVKIKEFSLKNDLQFAFIPFRTGLSPKAAEAFFIDLCGGVGELWNKQHTGKRDLQELNRIARGNKCPICERPWP